MNKSFFIFITFLGIMFGACSKHVKLLSPELVHLVFFDLKSEVDKESFIEALNDLKEIEAIQYFEVKNAIDLNDKRAVSNYEILLIIHFKSLKDYESYQNHSIHLNLKASMRNYLEKPPMTYDYRY